MSDTHEQAHTGPIKTPNQLLVSVLLALIAPVFIIIGLVIVTSSAPKPNAGAVNLDLQIAKRLQKVGSVEIKLSDADRVLHSGEEVYKALCAACHATGVTGAPKFSDAGEWGARIKTGFDALLQSSLKGKGNMPPQGGGEMTDIEIARGVAYMANAAGAKFKEPEAPKAEGEEEKK